METWAVVLATLVGPIAAVVITRLMDDRKAAQQRKFWILSTLMQLRGQAMHAEHVRALNVVQLEFSDSAKVIESWRSFIVHVETDGAGNVGAWNQKYQDLLTQLLLNMAKDLKVAGDEIDLRRGGYYPSGWAFQQKRIEAAQEFVEALSNGTKAVPIVVYGSSSSGAPIGLPEP